AAFELEGIVRRAHQLPRLKEADGQFFGEKKEERGDPGDEFLEVTPAKTLDTEGGAGAGGVIAGQIHQGPSLAKNVAAGEEDRGHARAGSSRYQLNCAA